MAIDTRGVTVAVIGAGPSGISMLKTLKDDGFSVALYERRERIGGLWAYTNNDAWTTALPTTRANISKFTCGFTDFEMPEKYPDYLTPDDFQEFMNDYATHFDLHKHIIFNTSVKKVARNRDDTKWVLEFEPVVSTAVTTGESTTSDGPASTPAGPATDNAEFDKVVFCHGYQTAARLPLLPGRELYTGPVLHSQQYRGPNATPSLVGKTVLVLGLGSTAGDVVPDLVSRGKCKVYLSHRRGAAIFRRRGLDGRPSDLVVNRARRQFGLSLTRHLPGLARWMADKGAAYMLARMWGHDLLEGEERIDETTGTKRFTARTMKRKGDGPPLDPAWRLMPFPSVTLALPSVAEDLVSLLREGKVTSVHGLRRFLGPRTVELDDGSTLDDVDAVVCCTGYGADFSAADGAGWLRWSRPAAPGSWNEEKDGEFYGGPDIARLYMNLFPPRHADSMAMLCYSAFGKSNGFSFSDVTSCAVSNIFRGAHPLPSVDEMERHVDRHQQWIADRWRLASRELAKEVALLGGKPTVARSSVTPTDPEAATTTDPAAFAAAAPPATPVASRQSGSIDVSAVRQWEWQSFLHDAAGTGVMENLGWGPKGWLFFLRQPRLCWLMNHGLETAHAYRYFETGKRPAWPAAGEAILRANEMVKRRFG